MPFKALSEALYWAHHGLWESGTAVLYSILQNDIGVRSSSGGFSHWLQGHLVCELSTE